MKEFTIERTGRTVRMDEQSGLFQVCLKHGKAETWLYSSDFTCVNQSNALSYRYRYAGDADEVEINIDFTLTQDELLSSLTATHRGDGVLSAVKYPCVRKDDVATF